MRLSPKMLASLYPDVLIERHAIPMPVEQKISYLGNNEKNILIVVNNENAVYLTDNELVFLTKVLGACDLSIADVAIINWKNLSQKDHIVLINELKSRYILLFDLDSIEFGLPIRFPAFQIQTFDKCTYLQAPALAAIEKDVDAKKQLWASLKKLFAI